MEQAGLRELSEEAKCALGEREEAAMELVVGGRVCRAVLNEERL